MTNFSDYLKRTNFSNEKEALLEAKKKKMIKPVEKLEKGDRLYTGTGNAAKRLGVRPAKYRNYFLKIKNGILKKMAESDQTNAGRAIAIAYYQTNKHFSK